MTIPTQMSLHGFIATAPQLNFTGSGVARFYSRIGVEHFRKETDGSFTKLEPSFHNLVMFKATAERAYARSASATRSSPRATSTSTNSTGTARWRPARSSWPDGSGTTPSAPGTASNDPSPSSPSDNPPD